MDEYYPRDLIGYGEHPPHPHWPNKAKIAVQFVINFEEGGENNPLHGDPGTEQFLSDIIGADAYSNRHLSMETLYEYGTRAGFWRLHRLFTQQQIPVTVFAVAMAMQRHPDAVQAMLDADWEIASHGYRWIHYQNVDEATEREHMKKALAIHKALTGRYPAGWYTGRTSPNTLPLVAEHEEILYSADTYSDDLPYWDTFYARPLLMVPYTLEANDMRFCAPQGFNSGEQFYSYLKDTFDVLYAEGASSPKMMNIGLHNRIIGRPGRFAALQRFVEYVKQHDDVWFATREQIARHWQEHFPV